MPACPSKSASEPGLASVEYPHVLFRVRRCFRPRLEFLPYRRFRASPIAVIAASGYWEARLAGSGLATGILLVGALIGALAGGRIADRAGRRPTVLGPAAPVRPARCACGSRFLGG